MAAQIVNSGNASEPLLFVASLALPRSGSVNDANVMVNESVLGVCTLTDLAPGVWQLTTANVIPLSAKLVITAGVETPNTSGHVTTTIDVTRDTANTFVITIGDLIIAAANNVSFANVDANAWVKIEKSVF